MRFTFFSSDIQRGVQKGEGGKEIHKNVQELTEVDIAVLGTDVNMKERLKLVIKSTSFTTLDSHWSTKAI